MKAGTAAGGSGARIEAVRAFNRFYTQQMGVLQEGLLHSPFTLTQVRVLYELAHWDDEAGDGEGTARVAGAPRRATPGALAARLALDEGYLSRILRAFVRDGLVRRARSDIDGRSH